MRPRRGTPLEVAEGVAPDAGDLEPRLHGVRQRVAERAAARQLQVAELVALLDLLQLEQHRHAVVGHDPSQTAATHRRILR